jgi:lipopolysaccharide export system protein LptC
VLISPQTEDEDVTENENEDENRNEDENENDEIEDKQYQNRLSVNTKTDDAKSEDAVNRLRFMKLKS